MADLKTRIVITSTDRTAAGIKSARGGLSQLDATVKRVKNSLLALAGISIGIGLVKNIAETADQMTLLEGRLRVVTDGEKELAAVQNELFESSQRTGTALRENVELFTRLQPAIEQLGGDYQTTIQLTETVAQSLRLSGASTAEAASLTRQLSQALQSSELRGDELNAVMENGGFLARQLADGLGVTVGELREMAFAGELTSDRVINTLLQQSAAVNEEFAKIPETLGTAFTKLNNAWEKFLGDLNKSTGATNTVAEGIAFIADNFGTLANAALHVGEVFLAVYAVKAVTALKATITQLIATTQANRLAAASALQAAQAEAARTAAVVRNLEVLAAQIRAQIAEAAATTDTTAAKWALLNVEGKLLAARKANAAAAASATAATRAGVASLVTLSGALNVALAGFAGFKLGEFLREEFEAVRVSGDGIANYFATLMAAIKGNLTFKDQRDIFLELKGINKEFENISRNHEDVADIARVNKEIAQSFDAVKASVKAVGEAMDSAFKQRQAELQQQSQNRLTDIDRLVENERQRQLLITAEIIRAGNEQTQLAQKYADERAKLIGRAFQEQINAARQLGGRTVEIERESAEQRKAIYEQLVQNYKGVIDRLIGEEKRFLDQARDYARQRADLNKSTEQRITEFQRSGMSEAAKQADIVRERDELLAKAREQLAKGFLEEALETTKRIEDLSLRSAEIGRDIAKQTDSLARQAQQAWDAGNDEAVLAIEERVNAMNRALTESSDAAISRVREANAIAEQALKALESQAKSAADAARNSYQQLQQDMAAAQQKVTETIEQLQKQTISEHRVNIDAERALSVIEALKKPTESTHTINVVRNDPGQQRRFGGPILRFNSGGHTPLSGQLPGFGGGDRIKALLEAGEFIIRKEAVQKYGPDLFERLNAMRVQPDKIIKRRTGGIVPVRRYAIGGGVQRFAGGGFALFPDAAGQTQRNLGRLMVDFDLPIETINSVLDPFKKGFIELSDQIAANLKLSTLQLKRDIKDVNVETQDQVDLLNQKIAVSIQSVEDRFKKVFDRAGDEFGRTIESINNSELSVDRSIDDAIRNIRREGLTEEEQYVDKVKELREKEQAAKEALARGDVEEAQRLNKEILSLAQSISTEVTDSAGNIIVQQEDAAATAIEFLNNAKALNGQIANQERQQARQDYEAKLAQINNEKSLELGNVAAEKAAELAKIKEVSEAAIAAANKEHELRMAQIKARKSAGAFAVKRQPSKFTLRVDGFDGAIGAATGGRIPGQGDGDTVPAMLTPGEFVIRKASVAKYGDAFMHKINEGLLPVQKFANGGPVAAPASSAPGVAISLALGGAQTTGTLDRGSATDEIIEALKDADMVS